MSSPQYKYINQSLLNMAAKCGKQVEFRYIDGIIIPPGFAAHRGTAVHKAAQVDAEVKRDNPESTGLTSEEMKDIAADEFERRVSEDGVYLAEEEAADALKLKGEAKDTALIATELYCNEVAGRVRKPILIEETVTVAHEELTYPLGGRLDLVHFVDGRGNAIQDIKTTEKKMFDGFATHTVQAPLYTMLAESIVGGPVGFDFEFLVIQKRSQENVKIRAEVTEQARQNVITRAAILERALRAGIFQPAPREAWWCSAKSCGYWGICEFGAKQSTHISLSGK